ncbi:UNVERIFIED_CONTAM: General transcription and DNA repair factor IIH helicase subunit XPD, partial [Sesamum latifolium]
MKFQIEDVTVYFPYDNIYPEQYSYMVELKRALDAKGEAFGASARILALGLSSRKNLCVNPSVISAENRDSVDAACRKLTASWVRAMAVENPNIPTCEFFENYEKAASDAVLPPGVYTLQVVCLLNSLALNWWKCYGSFALDVHKDLRAFGKEKGWCPYFLARHMVQFANVVVYSYQYLLDPKVAGIISKEMQRESVVVFDEAHNIDNVCIEALSVSVRMQTLEGATRNLNRMSQEIE